MRLNVDIQPNIYLAYKDLVGNMSEDIHNYITHKLKIPTDEKELLKKISKVNKELESLKYYQEVLNSELKQLQNKSNIIKEKQSLEIQEKLNFDPFAHLDNGRGKLNEVGRLLYRVEKGKFIPDWAKKRNPDDPKGFAIKVLSKILRNSEV